jgi:transposase
MSATLKLAHKTIEAEVRRGTYDAVVDGQRAGTLQLNQTIEVPVEAARHTGPCPVWWTPRGDRSSRTAGRLTMGSTRRSFTPEYKQDAVALIVDGGHTIVEVAKKLEISETSIRKWVKKIQPPTEPVPEKQLSESERAELARLRKENAKLEMQLEFAKKVSTWFAKGQQ